MTTENFEVHPIGTGAELQRLRDLVAQHPAPQPLYPDRIEWTIAEGFRLHSYRQGTRECIAFHRGIEFAEQHHAQQPAPQPLSADMKQLSRCANAVSDWLAGGCDANVIPRPQIAALAAIIQEATKEQP